MVAGTDWWLGLMPTYRAIGHRKDATHRADDEDELYIDPQRTLTVHVPHDEPIDTGLVDAHGVTLYRMPDERVIGFQRERG